MSRLIQSLREICGAPHVKTGRVATAPFRQGYRYGHGDVEAVVQPGCLLDLWRTVRACVEADRILIMQAANTGLTGGSTPNGAYDRPVIVLNTRRLTGVHLLHNGSQVLCLPGSTLTTLEERLAPLGREPHSVIGSSCIGASVTGGICNNSGGALVRRGPAYTELALYARVTEAGAVELVNHLGLSHDGDEESLLRRLDEGRFADTDFMECGDAKASSSGYENVVRDVAAETPARFNADPNHLFEASGSAGRIVVFAVRLDTFPAARDPKVFYIGSNDPQDLTDLRHRILTDLSELPISGEYIHRTCFDIADRYGKDTYLAIKNLGSAAIPRMAKLKSSFDALCRAVHPKLESLSDHVLTAFTRLLPDHLPPVLRQYRQQFEHHLLLKVEQHQVAETQALLDALVKDRACRYHACGQSEGGAAFLHRFAAAGAAVRYRALHKASTSGLAALDVAFPRNATDWAFQMPGELWAQVDQALIYGHFFCHVFHLDYVLKPGYDPMQFEEQLLAFLGERGVEYPAEHNVGHLYEAKPVLRNFYKSLDPTNSLNPGIGRTSRNKHWH